MNIVFRVDSSTKMGQGHLMRCLTLADEFKNKHYKTTFICRELDGNLNALVKQKKHEVTMLPTDKNFQSDNFYLNWLGATQEQDAEQVIKVIPENMDLLIVDSYALDEVWHKRLRSHTKKIMVIDDLANRKFDCDSLLNQNLGSKKTDYVDKVPNNCQLMLGCEYALLRPEFAQLRKKALEKRTKTKVIKNILVSMGGSDSKNLTYDILQDIDSHFNVIIVLGRSSPHNEMIKQYAQNKNITVIIDANNMAQLMLDADLAIGAGGATSWERCCLGLPTLLFITAENQKSIADNLEKVSAVSIVQNLKKDLQMLTSDLGLWEKLSHNAQSICNGFGVKKIVALC